MADPTGAETVYTTDKAALSKYSDPRKNREYSLYQFRQMSQETNETLDAFHTCLRQKAKDCEFHNADGEIKSQIILKCHSNKLRRQALENPNLDLDNLLEKGRTMEASERQASVLEHETHQVNWVKKSQVPYQASQTRTSEAESIPTHRLPISPRTKPNLWFMWRTISPPEGTKCPVLLMARHTINLARLTTL